MTAASAATSHCKKVMKFGISLFRRGFDSSKCKTMAKMAVARIKLLRNKREVVVRQMRRDVALLLQSGQDATARVRVEHVIREQNVMAANEFIELFCDLIVARLAIIAKRKECPADLKEGVSSLIFAAPRLSDIPELVAIRDIFEKKYGKDFVDSATDLRPDCGVNRMLIEKLSVRTPSGEVKLKIMKEIAKEYQVEWDTAESEMELLKPPEELIEGPNTFVSGTRLPMNPKPKQSVDGQHNSTTRCSDNVERNNTMPFQDSASAAEAAAESAKKAIAAAEAAAYLASQGSNRVTRLSGCYSKSNVNGGKKMDNEEETRKINRRHSYNMPSAHPDYDDETEVEEDDSENGFNHHTEMDDRKVERRHSHNVNSGIDSENGFNHHTEMDDRKVERRHSHNVNSGIKFDESDCDEEIEMEEEGKNSLPANRPAPQAPTSHVKNHPDAPRVHPKLPDYDSLAARFEALKHRKS